MTAAATGRRERKKAATRKAIGDAALRLFLDRGFDNVSIREIADAADVSHTTVFAYFPCKEAIAFDDDDEMRDRLIAAVTDRAVGTGIPGALRHFYLSNLAAEPSAPDGAWEQFQDLVNSSPALHDYSQKMWLRHENALADAIAADLGDDHPDATVRAFARCALQAQLIEGATEDLPGTVNAVFDLLEPGWETYLDQRG
jgi:AcrR family transcriptional regulator